ncbi:TetR/AcrR family transcriptional regulator [Actibacterium sp. D379-3]
MARPSKFDRDAALEIVMNEIWRNGYEASSVKALSERLGITRSSFYNAFGTREAMFREVLAKYFEQTPDRPLGTATPQTPIKPLLTNILREICRTRALDPEARGCLTVNCVAELCATHQNLGGLLAEAILGSTARIEQVLGWAATGGEIDETADLHTLALSVQSLILGLSVLSKIVHSETKLWAVAAATLKGLGLYEETAHAQH